MPKNEIRGAQLSVQGQALLAISSIGLSSSLLPAVIQLGRKHSYTLGFFPDGAFEEHAELGQLLAVSVGEAGAGCWPTPVP
jgi:hypothetical protein